MSLTTCEVCKIPTQEPLIDCLNPNTLLKDEIGEDLELHKKWKICSEHPTSRIVCCSCYGVGNALDMIQQEKDNLNNENGKNESNTKDVPTIEEETSLPAGLSGSRLRKSTTQKNPPRSEKRMKKSFLNGTINIMKKKNSKKVTKKNAPCSSAESQPDASARNCFTRITNNDNTKQIQTGYLLHLLNMCFDYMSNSTTQTDNSKAQIQSQLDDVLSDLKKNHYPFKQNNKRKIKNYPARFLWNLWDSQDTNDIYKPNINLRRRHNNI